MTRARMNVTCRLARLGVVAALALPSCGGGEDGGVPEFWLNSRAAPVALRPSADDVVVVSSHIAAPPPHPGYVFVYKADGLGGFPTRERRAVGTDPWDFAAADLDGDGLTDLVVSNSTSGNLALLRQVPSQSPPEFLPAEFLPASRAPYGIAVGDLNGDGRLDLAVAEQAAGATSAVILYQESPPAPPGRFLPPVPVVTGEPSIAVAIADVDDDGRQDLLVTAEGPGAVLLLTQGSDRALAPPVPVTAGVRPWFVRVADVNQDGRLDLLTVNAGSLSSGTGASVSIIVQGASAGSLTFLAPQTIPMPYQPSTLATGDFDGDGRVDLAVSVRDLNRSRVVLVTQSVTSPGLFDRPAIPLGSPHPTESVGVVDVDRDGRDDLLVSSGPALGDGTVVPNFSRQSAATPATFEAWRPLPPW